MGFSDEPSNLTEQESHETPAKSGGKAGLVFGVIAVMLILILSAGLAWTLVRLNRQMAQVSRLTEQLNRRIEGVLMTLQGYSIYVYGYTDDIGTQEYNLKLSGRRAQAVRDVLVQTGIKPGLITAKGFGKSDPRVKGDTAQARAANRRVEIG